jgi:hypothetical protein
MYAGTVETALDREAAMGVMYFWEIPDPEKWCDMLGDGFINRIGTDEDYLEVVKGG